MTGKVYIVEYDYFDKDKSDFVFEQKDNQKDWFYIKDSCETHLLYIGDSDIANCYERCFCGVYRMKIAKALKKGDIKKAAKLTFWGAIRFFKNKIEHIRS